MYFAQRLSPEAVEELKRQAPHVNFVVGLSPEQALARAAQAHGADAFYARSEFLKAATRLAWVHASSAGVDRYVGVEGIEAVPVLTNSRGVHGPTIADHVFAMLLTLTRDLRAYAAHQAQGVWQREGSQSSKPIALQGRTLCVVGLGGIGTEVAQRAHGFGMRVIATRRGEDPGPSYLARLGKPSDLLEFLAESDVVVLCVPLTAETEGLLGEAAFAAMKPGAYLVNIARGKVVQTDALLAALRSGRLAGACLDVTEPEPLPTGHPLWSFPNVVITPHVAANAELSAERGWALFVENVRRFDAGEALLNVVDLKAGY